MAAFQLSWQRAMNVAAQLGLAALLLCLLLGTSAARAQDKAQLFVTAEQGFGRLVLAFPGRLDLPKYRVKYDNGVLAVEFDQPINFVLPDVAATLPDYVSIGRVDPDKKGVRFGLRTTLNVNHMEAGEKLFVDLMPSTWQGLPPSLPPEVVAALSERAKTASILAEQKRKAEEALTSHPVATVRVGRNPTFMRVQFDWNVDAKGSFVLDGATGTLRFDWPVPIDLYPLKSDLPKELLGAMNSVGADGSHVIFKLAEGVVPRFYQTSPRQVVVDIDIAPAEGTEAIVSAQVAAEDLAARAALALAATEAAKDKTLPADNASPMASGQDESQTVVTPVISSIGGTVRVAFPFERDTAAAVFRRGDTVWMLFDTTAGIHQPGYSEELAAVASDFTVIPAGNTQVVRMQLSSERLATLGSEGRAWVLSLGDVLLNPIEPITLNRHRDQDGHFQMSADVGRPSQVHEFRDPIVGDVLSVVTAFPPARGINRDLSYVDFDTLRSIHGLVVKPEIDDLKVGIDGNKAVIQSPQGLTLSAQTATRVLDSGDAAEFRGSYVDFVAAKEDDPAKFVQRREQMIEAAAEAEGRAREVARLNLAQFYVGNQFAEEAIGVLKVLQSDLKTEELKKRVQLTYGIADTLAARPVEALAIFNAPVFSEEVDALMWRTIAKADAYDFIGARTDALAAESVLDAYPSWVKLKFLFAGIRAALETKDMPTATRYLGMIEFAKLDPEQVTYYQLFTARVAEGEGRISEALDAYGQVIAADVRPTRAEAVYRTLLLLEQTGKIDLAKATATLAAEALLWRGNPLEADMQKLLAELYFQHKDFRVGFETVKQAVAHYPESVPVNALLQEAESTFSDLYLNGQADQLGDVEALSLYYDFRQLTPPGARGDEMIRNLARRLVKVDLLSQAADLLEYQIDSRLKGVAQAQIAADLAVIRIADRNPEAALRVLSRTQMANLPPNLERQRRILEARALIDSGREELALDLLTQVKGRDADLLRVDGYWKTKNYAGASELLEIIYSPDNPEDLMTQASRMNILKAAVGFVLAGDKLGSSRLRSKFADAMSKSEEWPMFDFVTASTATANVEFRKVAREVSGLDSLNAFLASYRQMYPMDDALTPAAAAKQGQV